MRFLEHRPQLCNSPRGPLSNTPAPPTTIQTLSGPRGSLRAGPASFPHPQMAIYGWPLPGAALSETQTLTRVRDFPSVWRDSGQRAGPCFRSTSWALEPGGSQSFCKPGVSGKSDSRWGWVGSSSWPAWLWPLPTQRMLGWSRAPPRVAVCYEGMGSQTRRVDPVGGSHTG